MKGQIYLILAVIIIITLVLLKTNLNLSKVIENKRYLESRLDRLEFQNVRREMIKTIQLNYNQTQNITNNLINFMKFAKSSFSARTIELSGVLVLAQFPTVAAGVNTELNVTVFNSLGLPMQQLNISFDGSSTNRTDIADMQTISTSFTFSTSSSINYTLSIYYQTAEENVTASVTVPVEIGKSKFIGYFDLRLETANLKQKDRFTETVTL
jgi:hypothetical protein